jgi:hypothetical protein
VSADDFVIPNACRLDLVSVAKDRGCGSGEQPVNRNTIAVAGVPDKTTPDE